MRSPKALLSIAANRMETIRRWSLQFFADAPALSLRSCLLSPGAKPRAFDASEDCIWTKLLPSHPVRTFRIFGLFSCLLFSAALAEAQLAADLGRSAYVTPQQSYTSPVQQRSGLSTTFAPTQLEITPYVWGLHINSDDSVGSMALNSDLGLGKILRSLKGLAELEVAAKMNGFFVFGDGICASLELKPKVSIQSLDHINLQAGFATVAGGYAFRPFHVAGQGTHALYANIQPFAGGEYTDIAVTARTAVPSTLLHVDQEWWMPVAGARIDARSGKYLMRLEGDFSEFGQQQNGEQVLGAVGYELDKPRAGSPALHFGYRYLYDKKSTDASETTRLKLQGPVVFVTFHLHSGSSIRP